MKLKVELTWWSGVVAEGDPPHSEPDYELVDADTGRKLTERPFSSCTELEAYIAAHYPGCERWAPPAPAPDDTAKLERILGVIEQSRPDQFNPEVARPVLVARLYQSWYPPETVARIRKALGLPL